MYRSIYRSPAVRRRGDETASSTEHTHTHFYIHLSIYLAIYLPGQRAVQHGLREDQAVARVDLGLTGGGVTRR